MVDLVLSKQVAWVGQLFPNESIMLEGKTWQGLDITVIYWCVTEHNSY